MATFQVPVWFNVEAETAEEAVELIESALYRANEVAEAPFVLDEHSIDTDDVLEIN